MNKRKAIPGALVGAAVLGAIAYVLFNKKNGKKMRAELQRFVDEALRSGEAFGKVSRAAYEDAVETAAKMYRDSKELSSQQKNQLSALVQDLKARWQEAEKSLKKPSCKRCKKR